MKANLNGHAETFDDDYPPRLLRRQYELPEEDDFYLHGDYPRPGIDRGLLVLCVIWAGIVALAIVQIYFATAR